MFWSIKIIILFLQFIINTNSNNNKNNEGEFCYKDLESCSTEDFRYLLYDVNQPEGFNLRRDVYIRFAVLAHELKKTKLNNFKLVLPPWTHLYHWKSHPKSHYMWSDFFNMSSLQKFAPVIDIDQLFTIMKNKKQLLIDEIYILQHFNDMYESGNFEDRMEIQSCHNPPVLRFFYYNNITSNNIKCLSFHGAATELIKLLLNSTAKIIFIDHGEVALHKYYGDKIYWQARRSMRFNNKLKIIADQFRSKYLLSDDNNDNTLLPDDWRNEKPRRNAKGGPYLAVHLRRRDFLYSRPDEMPTINNIIKQIIIYMEKLNLNIIFIATDAIKKEYEELERKLIEKNYKVFHFIPTNEFYKIYGDGGVAIIDQIICSHAKFFIGTHESTFSFRIQEEREILGFSINKTFNCFCKNNNANCNQPTIWKIVY